MTLAIGAVADDFTGALDLANNFVRAGLRVAHLNGVTAQTSVPEDVDAVVIATKTRTAPLANALAETQRGLDWLRAHGVSRYYIKYCSTFDSTPQGNIGQIIDQTMDDLGTPVTIAAPAFPDAGRTVYRGHLFVGDVPLDESSMRHHPLTPMTDSSVVRLLTPQTRRRVELITLEDIAAGSARVQARLAALEQRGGGIAVVDTISDSDLAVIAQATASLTLVTGGSGLATTLPAAWGIASADAGRLPNARGARAILAGSVSAATNEQVAAYRGPKHRLDPGRVLRDSNTVREAAQWARDVLEGGGTPLIYTTAPPTDVARAQAQVGAASVSAALEDALSDLSRRLVEAGVRQLIVAGGETSGACVQALGIRELRIGQQIDPGVPWAYGESFAGGIHIALKSGNFGRPDFFHAAFEELK